MRPKHSLADDEDRLVNIIKGLKETLETYLIDGSGSGLKGEGLGVVDFFNSGQFAAQVCGKERSFNSNYSSLNSTLTDSGENCELVKS